MDITASLQNLLRQSASLRLEPVRVESAALRAWSDGQLLDALVVRRSAEQVTLKMPDRELTVRTPLLLEPGERLTVQVARDAGGRVELRVATLPENARNEALVRTLRTALPNQSALAPMLRSLATLVKQQDTRLPEPMHHTARQVLDAVRMPAQLGNRKVLQQAVRDSGLWQEARLARGEVPTNDLKTLLLRLAAQIRQALRQPATAQPNRLSPPVGSPTPPTSGAVPNAPSPGQPPAQSTLLTPGTLSAQPPGASAGRTPALPAGAGQVPALATGPAPGGTSGAAPSSSVPAERAVMEQAVQRSQSPAQPATAAESSPTGRVPDMQNALDFLRNLLRSTEGALARVQLQQLQTHSQQQQRDEPAWLLQIPVQTPDGFSELELRIRRGGREGEAGNSSWSAMLTIDGGRHGPIRAVVTLSAGQISALFRAREEATSTLIDDHLQVLRARLLEAGLAVGRLDNIPGMPDDTNEAVLFSEGLLREKA